MKLEDIPKEYRPFAALTLCSNGLHGVRIPVALGGHTPFLLGMNESGKPPLVWLESPQFDKPGVPPREWLPLVRANESLDKRVGVLHPSPLETIVHAGSHVFVASAVTSEGRCVVSKLDLRPLGLLLHGDSSGLNFAGQMLIGNVFSNADVAFAGG